MFSCSSYMMKTFVSRTITEGSVDLDKFPASRLRQLVKKFENSKATVHHIKQVAGNPQGAEINLMQHQQQSSKLIDTARREDQSVSRDTTRLLKTR